MRRTGTHGLAMLVAACALCGAACTDDPDLVGSVMEADIDGLDGGSDQDLPDAAADTCLFADAVSGSPGLLQLFLSIVALDCEIPYSWLITGPPFDDLNSTELETFLLMIQQQPPRPGALPEEPCGPLQGFRFDDPAAPTKIILCDLTCGFLKTQVAADFAELSCDEEPDAGNPQPTPDAGRDAGGSVADPDAGPDAGQDAGQDAGGMPEDAGADASADDDGGAP